ncbi:MAG: cyclic nucleotide-binding domain-containing protein [Chloroflexi bacterium]|nr:cyclic nucleotide-binding domain-containing protein [Chloroflexota bacterium]
MNPVEQLQQIPLFAPLSVEERAYVAPLFHRVRYQLGDVVFAQGAPGDAFYILETGVLRVWQVDAHGQDHVIDYYEPPRHFGETSLLTGIPHNATADVFSKEADLLVLPKNEWDDLLDKHPEIKEHLQIRSDIQQKLTARPFKWLAEGEYVVEHTRRHPFALLLMLRLPALAAGGMLLFALLIPILDALTGGALAWLMAVDALLWIGLAIWLLGSFGWAILDWRNDSLIVTNRRVVHFERVIGLFEEREEAPIERVANVNESSFGIAARLLNFSDIRVETAGHQTDISFSYVPRHLRLRQKIFEQIEEIRSRSEFEKRAQVRAEIRAKLQKHMLRTAGDAPAPAAPPLRAASPAPLPIRQRRHSTLGSWLNKQLGLQIEEQGKITWRKHWFDLFARAGKMLGISALIALLGPALIVASWEGSAGLTRLLLIAAWVILLSITAFLAWYKYEDWRNDIYQLTDERVLDIERSPFRFKERLVETTLERIQNVSYNKPNLLANLLNYGDLKIETAGGQGQLVFSKISNPQWVAQEIFRRRDAHRERQQHDQARRNQEDFLDWFLEYNLLLQQKGDVSVLPAALRTPPSDAAPSDDKPTP